MDTERAETQQDIDRATAGRDKQGETKTDMDRETRQLNEDQHSRNTYGERKRTPTNTNEKKMPPDMGTEWSRTTTEKDTPASKGSGSAESEFEKDKAPRDIEKDAGEEHTGEEVINVDDNMFYFNRIFGEGPVETENSFFTGREGTEGK